MVATGPRDVDELLDISVVFRLPIQFLSDLVVKRTLPSSRHMSDLRMLLEKVKVHAMVDDARGFGSRAMDGVVYKQVERKSTMTRWAEEETGLRCTCTTCPVAGLQRSDTVCYLQEELVVACSGWWPGSFCERCLFESWGYLVLVDESQVNRVPWRPWPQVSIRAERVAATWSRHGVRGAASRLLLGGERQE